MYATNESSRWNARVINNTSWHGRRVTFLVNVWLNHTPKSAVPLPKATAAVLKSGRLDLELSVDESFVAPTVVQVTADAAAAPEGRAGAGEGAEAGGASRSENGHEKETGEGRWEADWHANGGVRSAENFHLASCGSACTGSNHSTPVAALKSVPAATTDCVLGNEEAAQPEVGGYGNDVAEVGAERLAVETTIGSKNGVEQEFKDSCCDKVENTVVHMRWEFGEVGPEAEEQVYLRHEVVMPVPASLAPSDLNNCRVSDGESFCLIFPLPSGRPQVSRIGEDREGLSESEGSSSGQDEEGEEEEEEWEDEDEGW